MTTPYLNSLIGLGKMKVYNPDNYPTYFDEVVICTWKLGTIFFDTIPYWPDRDKYLKYAGSLHDCISGATLNKGTTVMQQFERDLKGTPIELKWDGKNGALLTATVASIKTALESNTVLVLTHDTGTIDVRADFSKEFPLNMEYTDDNRVLMAGSLYLIRV